MKHEIFKSSIEILEESFSWKLPKGALKIWWSVLIDEPFSSEDFEKGCMSVVRNSKRFPTLNELIEASQKACSIRVEKEQYKQKREEGRYRNLSQEEILANGVKTSPKAKAWIEETTKLLRGQVDKATWERMMKKIGEQ